jgi:hypothetical protein
MRYLYLIAFVGSVRAADVTVFMTGDAMYDGDDVYLASSTLGAGSVTIDKGVVGFALTAGKPAYTVGEPITLTARVTHPKVPGATPTGKIMNQRTDAISGCCAGRRSREYRRHRHQSASGLPRAR